jgi:hypothetical protein
MRKGNHRVHIARRSRTRVSRGLRILAVLHHRPHLLAHRRHFDHHVRCGRPPPSHGSLGCVGTRRIRPMGQCSTWRGIDPRRAIRSGGHRREGVPRSSRSSAREQRNAAASTEVTTAERNSLWAGRLRGSFRFPNLPGGQPLGSSSGRALPSRSCAGPSQRPSRGRTRGDPRRGCHRDGRTRAGRSERASRSR